MPADILPRCCFGWPYNLSSCDSRIAQRSPSAVFSRRWDVALLAIALVIFVADHSVARLLSFFAPLPVWLATIIVLGLVKLRHAHMECGDLSPLSVCGKNPVAAEKRRQVAALQMGVVLAILSLGLLAKILLNAEICHYGFVLAMPGVMMCVVGSWWLGEEIARRGGAVRRYAAMMLGLVLLGAGPHLGQMAATLAYRRAEVAAGRDAAAPPRPRGPPCSMPRWRRCKRRSARGRRWPCGRRAAS